MEIKDRIEVQYTIAHLESKLQETIYFKNTPINIRTVGRFLCGENWELAKYPFSPEFITNVAFNGEGSMYAILLVQMYALAPDDKFVVIT
jgi:hypothetical protein